jgi:hypothetical protein
VRFRSSLEVRRTFLIPYVKLNCRHIYYWESAHSLSAYLSAASACNFNVFRSFLSLSF